MGSVARVQILDKADYILDRTNIFEKDTLPNILPPAMGR